jgi:hypothetical protein
MLTTAALMLLSIVLSGCEGSDTPWGNLTDQEARAIGAGLKNISSSIETKRKCVTVQEDIGLDQINSVLVAHKSAHRIVTWPGKPPLCRD